MTVGEAERPKRFCAVEVKEYFRAEESRSSVDRAERVPRRSEDAGRAAAGRSGS